MNKVTVIGFDLAKRVFQVHGMDSKGTRLVSSKLTRKELPQNNSEDTQPKKQLSAIENE